MLETILLDRALCLPAVDIAALLQGQLIVTIPRVSLQKGWIFALYPYIDLINTSSIKQQYRSPFLALAEAKVMQPEPQSSTIEAWAKCEYCTMLHEVGQLDALSSLTIWTKDFLKTTLEERKHLFLAFLKIYRLPKSIEVTNQAIAAEKSGRFVSLFSLSKQFQEPLRVTEALPVLSDVVFDQRKQELKELRPFPHSELEALPSALSKLALITPKARVLEEDIKTFLGWSSESTKEQLSTDFDWIKDISTAGNSSDGYKFEKFVRKSLIELGFQNTLNDPKASLEPEATGGAGGIDVYCNIPYPLVGECKASKHENVPNSVSAQLIHLGNTHLGKQLFEQSIKIIFVAGKLTEPAQKATLENQMNVMRPETLQRLVELKVKHQGSINLLDLKSCLEENPFGEDSDLKVNKYIDKIWKEVKVRSEIIQAVKELTRPDKKQLAVMEIRVLYNARFAKHQSAELNDETTHDILIELSSPLTGYLGRVPGTSLHSDRFYFLRDFPID
jgi:hypothetical protein